ncbi:MAG: hypothetical protein CMH64_02335 [Nanoarchaeota archaeon]|nr:hypothetical protein [Nanoarchaeota archaeon]|tara:strand:+ start:28 stop:417 length:390 start_codon:yes stop_codon:yes gene_type:complete
MHLKTKVAEYGIIVDNKKFLMMRFSKKANKSEKWIFPGGRMETKDKPRKGLEREIREETKLKVKILDPFDVVMWGKGEDKRYAVFFLCKLISGEVDISWEHQEYKWFKFSEINKIDFHNKAFKDVLRKV